MATKIIPYINPLSPSSTATNGLSIANSFNIRTSLTTNSRIEFFVKAPSNDPELPYEILYDDYNFTSYQPISTQLPSGSSTTVSDIKLSPLDDYDKVASSPDEYIQEYYRSLLLQYCFLNNEIGDIDNTLYISDISSDRKEITLSSLKISDPDIAILTNQFIQKRDDSDYFVEFYLNFGEGLFVKSVNLKLDTSDPVSTNVVIKLKDPLPIEFEIQQECWVITQLEETVYFQVIEEEDPIELIDTLPIQGPNFNLELKDQVNNSTLPMSYSDLINTSQTSSLNQLNNLLKEKEININIDYTDFNNFVHFSSAKTRVENFQYKIGLIESYSSSISTLDNTSTSTHMSSSKASFEGKLSNIINNFDGYERYLYYNTGSYSYPKTSTQIPYTLAKSDSIAALNWLGNGNENSPLFNGILSSASIFDTNNRNQLLKSIPEYLRNDSENQLYELFIDMVAQHYDNIWIYLKDVTNKYNNDNRLDVGVSKDLVADAIRDFGVKLYQNNFSNNDLFTAFLGITPDGNLFPYPNMTDSLPVPTGSEYVSSFVSASNNILPQEDVNKSLYKRIYHNLPYLLKSKGTIPGLKALITSYGIPDTILRVNEYGGKDKVDVNDWDHWQNEFNYSYHTNQGAPYISSSFVLHPSWSAVDNSPETLMFRFKTDGLPTTGTYYYSQSLWRSEGPSSRYSALTLTYTGSGYTSASHEGSIKDPYYQYATLDFYPDQTQNNNTASVYLPFFDGDWWSVMITRNSGSDTFALYSQNKIYEGGDNNTSIGFNSSDTVVATAPGTWHESTKSYFPSESLINSKTYSSFSGSYQEIRYYATRISESVFQDYTMNPYSIEGNSLNTSPNELAFRAPLGGELYTGSNSIHPKVTGSWIVTQSFSSSIDNSSFYYSGGGASSQFRPNTEFFFVDQPVAGIKNVIGDKIRIEDNVFPGGYSTSSVLSPYESLLQQTNISQSYTPNINYLEVAFSPQNQINEDIMSQLGFFNIGDYIGDPRLRSSSAESYPALDKLRDEYFEKYIKNYNLTDFIRLIKFFDNSLFKMIKDFVPARTSLASGLVIKQHLLERNKYPQPQADINTPIAKYPNNQLIKQKDLLISGTVHPQSRNYNSGSIVVTNGGTGGVFDPFNNLNTSPYGVLGTGPNNKYYLTQSWSETLNTTSGSITQIISNQDEFYDGEFSGSIITATTQSLQSPYPLLLEPFTYSIVLYKNSFYGENVTSSFAEGQFFNNNTTPDSGEIFLLAPRSYVVFSPSFPRGQTIFTNPYMKIHKDDCDGSDNTVALGQVTQLKIKHHNTVQYITYDIETITEYSTYYLYKLNQGNITTDGLGVYSEVKNYFVSSSFTGSQIIRQVDIARPKTWGQVHSFQTESGDFLNYWNTSSGDYLPQNTPNIPLVVTASIFSSGSAEVNGAGRIYWVRERNGVYNDVASVGSINLTTTTSTTLKTTFTPINGDTYFLKMDYQPGGGSKEPYILTASLLITQSITPSASVCVSTFMEPYITDKGYYNSDFNPLINNIMDNRLSTIYQDVDYSSGINTPVNFAYLISGSAVKFPIRDSHYTQKSSIIPRYEGAKTTSQKLNTWTKGDSGTYGKTPTIDSLKSLIVYSDWIGGYPPEHMNASGVHVQYLINQDGTIKIPNTSLNSLEDVQQAFESENKLLLNSTTVGSGDPIPTRNIIKGGYRIEPILYTQYGHSPALFNVTASFRSSYISDLSIIGDYRATSTPSGSNPGIPKALSGNGSGLDFNDNILIGGDATAWSANKYTVDQDLIDENVTLTISTRLGIQLQANAVSNQPYTVVINLIHKQGSTENVIDTGIISFTPTTTFPIITTITDYGLIQLAANLTPQNLQVGDEIFVRGRAVFQATSGVNTFDVIYNKNNSNFRISQNPAPTNAFVSSSGTNTIWGYPNSSLSYAITASSPVLNDFYGSEYKMDNTKGYVTGSGFGTVDLPWELKIGDEFRFEGNENNVFMVQKIYDIGDSDSYRLSNTGSIEIHFDKNITTQSINLDNFLIRRYVPDASQIVMEGFKPLNSVGPYIVKPEYVSSELNKGIDDYIVDLTDKDLI